MMRWRLLLPMEKSLFCPHQHNQPIARPRLRIELPQMMIRMFIRYIPQLFFGNLAGKGMHKDRARGRIFLYGSFVFEVSLQCHFTEQAPQEYTPAFYFACYHIH